MLLLFITESAKEKPESEKIFTFGGWRWYVQFFQTRFTLEPFTMANLRTVSLFQNLSGKYHLADTNRLFRSLYSSSFRSGYQIFPTERLLLKLLIKAMFIYYL